MAENSAAQMRKIKREITWLGAGWFLWGIALAVADRTGLHAATKAEIGGWFALGGLATLMQFIVGCTEAILQKLDECKPPQADYF